MVGNFRIIDEEMETPSENRNGEAPDYSALFEAPDLATFIKAPKTETAREYEKRVRSLLKAGIVTSVSNGNIPDAATFIYFGPGFASAAGQLAEADEHAKRMIDLVTSPSNPYGLFLMAAIPMISQLFRNHESQVREIPGLIRGRKQRRAQRKQEAAATPKATVKVLGRSIRVGFKLRFPVGKIFAGFRSETVDPRVMAYRVFSDQKVINELRKQGVVFPVQTPPDDANGHM